MKSSRGSRSVEAANQLAFPAPTTAAFPKHRNDVEKYELSQASELLEPVGETIVNFEDLLALNEPHNLFRPTPTQRLRVVFLDQYE